MPYSDPEQQKTAKRESARRRRAVEPTPEAVEPPPLARPTDPRCLTRTQDGRGGMEMCAYIADHRGPCSWAKPAPLDVFQVVVSPPTRETLPVAHPRHYICLRTMNTVKGVRYRGDRLDDVVVEWNPRYLEAAINVGQVAPAEPSAADLLEDALAKLEEGTHPHRLIVEALRMLSAPAAVAS